MEFKIRNLQVESKIRYLQVEWPPASSQGRFVKRLQGGSGTEDTGYLGWKTNTNTKNTNKIQIKYRKYNKNTNKIQKPIQIQKQIQIQI